MTIGGDHLTSLPVLRALAAEGPVGMIHFDSHTDFYDSYFGGFKYTHGTPFRRIAEECYACVADSRKQRAWATNAGLSPAVAPIGRVRRGSRRRGSLPPRR